MPEPKLIKVQVIKPAFLAGRTHAPGDVIEIDEQLAVEAEHEGLVWFPVGSLSGLPIAHAIIPSGTKSRGAIPTSTSVKSHDMNIETRRNDDRIELRDRTAGQAPLIRGYASVFHQWATIFEDDSVVIREKVLPSAFANALREKQDVRALFNHNPSLILGRAKSGTLRLSVDARGLVYEIDPPDTSAGRNTLTAIKRGDVSQSSFGFVVRAGGEKVTRSTRPDGKRLVERELADLDLIDVSPVTFPAYDGTSVTARHGKADEAIERILKAEKVKIDMEVRLQRLHAADHIFAAMGAPSRPVARHETPKGAKRRR